MGKRKKSSRKPQGPRKNEPLATVFTCLFCNHEKSVTVKIDKKGGVGNLECKVCGQRFQCGVNPLGAAVDVYSEWVDAADSVARENEAKAQTSSRGRLSTGRPAASSRKADEYDDEDDDDGAYGREEAAADEDDLDEYI